jgi:5-methylcytosine-specific restriction protein A
MSWPTTSRQSRGYDAEWDRIRLFVLQRDNGLCQCDRCRGGEIRLTTACEVNHIKPKAKGGTGDPANLQAVSHDCHVRITAEQQGKVHRPKVIIGLDGYPSER